MSFTTTDVATFLDRESPVYYSQFEGAFIENQGTLDGENIFKVAHDIMVQEWDEKIDYELGVIEKGRCTSCCSFLMQKHKLKEVITQIGAARFGLHVGVCISCINVVLKNTPLLYLLKFTVPFEGSDDKHQISLTPNYLENLVMRESPIGDSEAGRPLSGFNKFVLGQVLEESKPVIEQCRKEQSKEMLCKRCSKLKITDEQSFQFINAARKAKHVMGCCLGCEHRFQLISGCSIVTCDDCKSSTKTCVACVEGAAGFSHNLKECTAKVQRLLYDYENAEPLPPLLRCDCIEDIYSS